MKKKLKKIFSKITVLVLLVATLVPYVNIPTVEAETEKTCANGEWEYHTNYYFFLAAENPFSWLEMFEGRDTAVTYYSTEFLYTFPSNGSVIDFDCDKCSSDFVKITDGKASKNFNPSDADSREEWTTGDFYTQLKEADSEESVTELNQFVFTNDGTGTEDDRVITYLFHGDYAYLGTTEDTNSREGMLDLNDINTSDDTVSTDGIKISSLMAASIAVDDSDITRAAIGSYNGWSNKNLKVDSLHEAIEDYNYENKGHDIVYKKNNHNEPLIKLVIQREYLLEDILKNNKATVTNAYDNLSSGEYSSTSGAYLAGGRVTGTYNSENVVYGLPINEGEYITTINPEYYDLESYEGVNYSEYHNDTAVSYQKAVQLTDESEAGQSQSLWFLSPTLYQMSYRVCKDAETPSEGEVTLSYNANKPEGATGNVTGMPENQKQTKGSEFTISDKKPELEGYKFKSWNISAKCDEQSYEPSYKLGKLENDTPLFACWVSTSTTEPGKTGVLTYTGLFAGIIALAGGSYYLIKKKNLFKKI